MSEAARSHRSDVRVEPYMDAPVGPRSGAGDPLAELARVVGQDDPFRAMFRPGKPGAIAAHEPVVPFPHQSVAPVGDAEADPDAEDLQQEHLPEDHGAIGLRPSDHDVHDWSEADQGVSSDAEAYDDPPAEQFAEHGYEDPHAEATPLAASHYAAPALTPDLWAARAEDDDTARDLPMSDDTAVEERSSRRPLIVLMAVLALTGGGLGATFLSRSNQNVVTNGGSAPTILAAAGPTKVKQTEGASDVTPVDADAALLSTKVGSSGPVKVVNSQEQPIDLAQLPKSANGSSDTGAANTSTPFPEPKKVKTFLVHPDGTLVGSSSAAPAPVRSVVPSMAIGSPSDDVAAPTPSARPSTPKTGNHSSATPKAPPSSIADLAAPDAADVAKAKQPASPGAKPGNSKPVEMAETATNDATASTGTGGNFALQLAASPNEQDARSAFTKLQKKYSELGGLQPTVKKVDTGQKTLYRLRVGNLSQDQAKTLCSQLQASGGSCFVVHN